MSVLDIVDMHKKYTCFHPECDERFLSMKDMDAHLKSIHDGDNIFMCPLYCCYYETHRVINMSRHLATHEEKPFECAKEDCNFEFSTIGEFADHVITHENFKQYLSFPKKEKGVASQDGRKVIPSNKNYEIDEDGNVFSLMTGKRLSSFMDDKGYMKVVLSNIKASQYFVHILVVEAFIGNAPDDGNKYSVHHIDRIRHNNNVKNLKWATLSEQAKESTREKERPASYHPVQATDKDGNITIFESMNHAAKKIDPDGNPGSFGNAVRRSMKSKKTRF